LVTILSFRFLPVLVVPNELEDLIFGNLLPSNQGDILSLRQSDNSHSAIPFDLIKGLYLVFHKRQQKSHSSVIGVIEAFRIGKDLMTFVTSTGQLTFRNLILIQISESLIVPGLMENKLKRVYHPSTNVGAARATSQHLVDLNAKLVHIHSLTSHALSPLDKTIIA